MRTAAGLHGGDLLGVADVGNVKDTHASETLFLRRRNVFLFFFWLVLVCLLVCGWRSLGRESLNAAIEPAIRHLDGHEHQIFVDRDVALPTGADHRGQQLGVRRVRDVKNIHAIKISLEEMAALEGKVGVRETQLRDGQMHLFWNL